MDVTLGEIEIMEEQLEDLKCSYEGWINMVAWAALPKQHKMTESDLQAGLEILGLVYKELLYNILEVCYDIH